MELSKLQEFYLCKLAEENEFYRSIYYQWKDNKYLSEKQYSFVENATKKKIEAVNNTRKLTEF